ncbi:C-type mannose receptor 2-like [Homarus americanus]|uniref:C-type mannose receptor 2-like n=1 Tax=Homarus americanus TaxID=6706 RepID=UPI001C45333F|nr:C-type mannose receptor 2-like [Homarus americanus]
MKTVRCPAGWTYWDNHCYYYSDKQTTWDLAHSACNENFGSELVSVISKDEDDYLQQVLTAQSKNIWLGLHDDNNGHNWHWVDGTPVGFTNWYPGEPNNQGGIEHCGEKRTVDYIYAGKWNDMPCSSENYYVCKITVTTCPQTWTLHEGKCYFASNYEITWHEARDKCQEFNTKADLISIHSEEDNNFFTTQLTQSSPATWLGLTYNSTYQKWSWSDSQVNNYTNWNGGEPNNLYNEWCTECIDYPGDMTDGKWNNLDCTQSRAFGCELFPTHVVGCDDGWMGFDKYCYWYNDPDYVYLSATYSDARSDCQSKGGDLVSIHSAEENDFVVALTSPYDSTWIGMTSSSHEGSFQWTDDTSITYTNWEFLYNSV